MSSNEKKKPALGEIAHTVEDAVANKYRKVKQYVSSVIRSLSPAEEAFRSPKKGPKMTLIEKGPTKVQTTPGGHRPGARKAERTASRSVEIKGKRGGKDTDLISSATSALRRLNFRSAGGSNPKRVASSSPLPHSSTEESKSTINTSIESAATMYTTVTMTDAEQDDKDEQNEIDKKTAKDEALKKFKENMEPKDQTRRNRELLIAQIEEVCDENARLLNAQKSKMKTKKTGGKSGQGTGAARGGGAKKGIVDHKKPVSTTVTIQHLYKGKPKKGDWPLKKLKQPVFVEDKGTNIGESFDKGASGGAHAASASPPTSVFPQEQQFFLTPAMLDENASDYDLIRETEKLRKEKLEKPKSHITTIQSKMPQYTFSTNFNKRKKTGDSQEKRKSEEDTRFPFPPRNHSLDWQREMSTSLRKFSDDPFSPISSHKATTHAAPAPLTLANLKQHERNVSEESHKYRTFSEDSHKYRTFSEESHAYHCVMDFRAPSTLPFFNAKPSTSGIDYKLPYKPRAESNMTTKNDDSEDLSEGNVAGAIIKDDGKATSDKDSKVSQKRKKGQDKRSASLEISDDDVKFVRSRNSRDAFLKSLGERSIGSPQDKYSVLSTDGSVKNYVSESGDESKKSGENIKKKTTSKSGEYPQRHRRVSIIQGESLRHFIFEEPDPSRMKPSKQRKMSKVIEDTTRTLLLEDIKPRITTNKLGDSMNAPAGDEGAAALENKPRKFSINTLGDIVSARKFSLLPPGEIYTSHVDGKTTEVIKLAPVSKGRPLATIVVQQASIQRGSISGPSNIREPCHLDVGSGFSVEELRDLNMRYGSPHHSRSQSVKTPGRSCGRPNYLCLPQQRSRVASMPNTGVEEEFYRLRHFSITGKGLINRGDSLKSRRSRSNTSVASSNSSHSTDHLANACAVGSHPGSSDFSFGSSKDSSTLNLPYRVMMLGACDVGKTTLICQFMTSEYLSAYDSSLDEDVEERTVAIMLDDEESELVFVDRPYTEVLLTRDLYRIDAQAFVIVYSVVDRESFMTAQHILELVWNIPNIATKAVILVANKGDLARSRTVTYDEGVNMAKTFDCKFIETSAGIHHNVDELLVGILTQIRLKLNMRPNRTRSPFDDDDDDDNDNDDSSDSRDLGSDEKKQLQNYREWFRAKETNDSDDDQNDDKEKKDDKKKNKKDKKKGKKQPKDKRAKDKAKKMRRKYDDKGFICFSVETNDSFALTGTRARAFRKLLRKMDLFDY